MSCFGWVTTPSWLSSSLRYFVDSSFMCSFHFFLISSASYKFLPFFVCVCPTLGKMFPWYFQICCCFLYFCALFPEECLLVSPCYSWRSVFSCVYLSLSPLLFASLLSSGICKASSDNHFAFLLFFSSGRVLFTAFCTMLWTSVHSSSSTLFTRSNHLNLFITSTVYS